MVVVQVADEGAMIERAVALGLRPLMTGDFHGSPISQWHPRDFGTIAEFDQMNPADSWHLAPAVYSSRSTAVVRDIVGVRLAVPDPAAMAARWATVSGGALQPDGITVAVGGRNIGFLTREPDAAAFAVDCLATNRDHAGTAIRLCGVDFTLI